MNSLERVAAERAKQEQKWGAEHDDSHVYGELAAAGECFARYARVQILQYKTGTKPFLPAFPTRWPFEPEAWKPADNPKENLIKAAAMLLAEYDRLERVEQKLLT